MFRGIEMILRGRDPRDAWVFAQRACGVCTTVHALASVRSVENALGLRNPQERSAHPQPDARGFSSSRTTSSTSTTCTRSTGWTSCRRFRRTRKRRRLWPSQSQTGPNSEPRPTSPGCATSSTRSLPVASSVPRQWLLGTSGRTSCPPSQICWQWPTIWKALDWQGQVIKNQAVREREPTSADLVVGGMGPALDPNSPKASQRQNASRSRRAHNTRPRTSSTASTSRRPAVASFYRTGPPGSGIRQLPRHGDFPDDDSGSRRRSICPEAESWPRPSRKVLPVDHEIAEAVAHSWYEYSRQRCLAPSLRPARRRRSYSGPFPRSTRSDR